MAERLKAAVLKTASRVIVTGVRIPLPPPHLACFPLLAVCSGDSFSCDKNMSEIGG
jgi:hypothetical protein